MLAGGLVSCQGRLVYFAPFAGSWKLHAIQLWCDEIGDFHWVEIEPKDCDTCYTLTFDEKGEAHGISIFTRVHLVRVLLEGNILGHKAVFIDEQDEPFDGNLYRQALKDMQEAGISITRSRMGIHFGKSEDQTVLRYKPIKP